MTQPNAENHQVLPDLREPRKLNLQTEVDAHAEARRLMPDPEDTLSIHKDPELDKWQLWFARPSWKTPKMIADGDTLDAMIWALETSSYPEASKQRVRRRAQQAAFQAGPMKMIGETGNASKK